MRKIFMRGIVAVTPLALTLVLLVWLYNMLESIFRPPLEAIIGKQYYFQGMGILVAFICIFFVGTILNSWIMRLISQGFERILSKIPLVKTLYQSIEEVIGQFRSRNGGKQGQVVLVEILGMKLVGIVTRETFVDAPQGIAEEGEIAVYLPMSYQIGGYTIMLPRSQVRKLPMTVEEGMRFTMTAGVLAKKNLKK